MTNLYGMLSGQNATDITRSSRGHGNYFEIETLDITSNTPNIKKEPADASLLGYINLFSDVPKVKKSYAFPHR